MRAVNFISGKLANHAVCRALLYSIANVSRKSVKNYSNDRTKFLQQKTSNIDTSFKTNNIATHKQTICALASGSGACGVAILRLSGPNALTLGLSMTNKGKLNPRYAVYSSIYHPISKELIDMGLVLWFPGPNSFTGEDVLEFHVHGSPSIVKCLLAGIVDTGLARVAEAGEFTRRAFYNNKMDLAEVEGLRDLLNADTEVQRKQALAMSRGVQSKKVSEWVGLLTNCASLMDGHIEFGDTDQVDVDVLDINHTLQSVQTELQQAIIASVKGFTIKNGINVALYGVTNVGKSSLLNALTAEDRAIVSDTPNTTRDLIRVRMDLNGYAANLTDTAGFCNDPRNRVETEAMKKSVQVLFDPSTAIHVLVISVDVYLEYARKFSTSASDPAHVLKQYVTDMFVSGLLREDGQDIEELFVKPTIVVLTKLDLIQSEDEVYFDELLKMKNVVGTSAVSNVGMDKLFDSMNHYINGVYIDFNPEEVQFCTVRTLQAVKMASRFVANAILLSETSIDVKAQFIRAAIGHLAGILGDHCSKDMLDDIFDKFCVGK